MVLDTTLLEVSWEVCNKVGGIFTVVKSKAPTIQPRVARYITVGPFVPEGHASEFLEQDAPDDLKEIFTRLEQEGILCHYGKWLANVEIETILIDYSRYTSRKDDIKAELWQEFEVDSLYTSYFDWDEPVIWATAVGRLAEELAKNGSLIVHAHEWMAAAAILHLKTRKLPVPTVFTTHATMYGRSLIGAGINIYESEIDTNPLHMEQTSLRPKHQMELAAASNATVFTTVSPITALETERVLGKKPDVILYNGFNVANFPTFEEASVKHQLFKGKIKEFLLYMFFPYYDFDLDNTLVYFLASRYETRAKGIDLYIKSLAELNRRLIKAKSKKTIAAFLWVPTGVHGINSRLVQGRNAFTDIKGTITDEHDRLIRRLITSVVAQRSSCDETYLLGEQMLAELKRKLLSFKQKGTPPVCTHNLTNPEGDDIMNLLAQEGLFNRKEDRVKIIYYPVYLTGSDELLDLSYYEAIQGSHLGVFPSFYEPWGYTPVEAAAMGVPSITTDLAGFGRYLQENKEIDGKNPGVFVIPRLKRADEQVMKELTDTMERYATIGVQERIKHKIEAKRVSAITDWEKMIEYYLKAYEMAQHGTSP